MGKRGPAPQPTALKRAKGETRPSRVNSAEPIIPAPASVEPPTGLTGAGLSEWKRQAPLLRVAGVLKQTDLTALEDYCHALSDLRRYEQAAKKKGAVAAIESKLFAAVIKLRSQVNTLRRELGLSPSSRSSIRVSDIPPDHGETNKATPYLKALPGGRR